MALIPEEDRIYISADTIHQDNIWIQQALTQTLNGRPAYNNVTIGEPSAPPSGADHTIIMTESSNEIGITTGQAGTVVTRITHRIRATDTQDKLPQLYAAFDTVVQPPTDGTIHYSIPWLLLNDENLGTGAVKVLNFSFINGLVYYGEQKSIAAGTVPGRKQDLYLSGSMNFRIIRG